MSYHSRAPCYQEYAEKQVNESLSADWAVWLGSVCLLALPYLFHFTHTNIAVWRQILGLFYCMSQIPDASFPHDHLDLFILLFSAPLILTTNQGTQINTFQ